MLEFRHILFSYKMHESKDLLQFLFVKFRVRSFLCHHTSCMHIHLYSDSENRKQHIYKHKCTNSLFKVFLLLITPNRKFGRRFSSLQITNCNNIILRGHFNAQLQEWVYK